MASVFLRTHIVHMKLGHCGMEYINIACLMLIAVAFMRSVPQIGYLLFFLRKMEFQAEPGKDVSLFPSTATLISPSPFMLHTA